MGGLFRGPKISTPIYRTAYLNTAYNTIKRIVGDRVRFSVDAIHDMAEGRDVIVIRIDDPERGRLMLKDFKDDFPSDQIIASLLLLWG